MNSVADVWENVIRQLGGELSQTTISTWFDEIEAVSIEGNVLTLHCGNDFKKGYIETLFMKNIRSALRDLFSMDFQIEILDDDAYAALDPDAPPEDRGGPFNSDKFTFENFVVGPSNKLAYAASRSVANYPAKHYNPLLIYGSSGLGKTHLMYAIANVIRRERPRSRIAYAKGDEMTNELVTAIQEGNATEMREKYRKADLLLVDDVQFIAGKKQTQQEFFHTFNALYESGRQIVLTSDRPPSEMPMLEDRLRTRFEWGLLVDVEPPDFETRVAIARTKAASRGITLPDTVATYIAENVTTDVRQLEGTVNKVMAYKDLLDADVDQATVRRAMRDILKAGDRAASPEQILDQVSKVYDVEIPMICGGRRNKEAVQARHVAIYLIRTMTDLPLEDIGKIFGGRDHSTIMHSVRQIEARMRKDPSLAEQVRELRTNISSYR